MKIIRNKKPISIWSFLIILLIVMICWWILWLAGVFVYFRYFLYEDDIYDTNEEVMELFEANTEEFEDMIKLLKETDVVGELFERYMTEEKRTYPSGKTLSDPAKQLKNSGFATDEQIEIMDRFFKKYKVQHIFFDKFIHERGCIFDFYTKTHAVIFMYCEKEYDVTEDISRSRSDLEEVTRLSTHWYCGTSKNDEGIW